MGIERGYPHSECRGHPCKLTADTAQPDNQQGLAADLFGFQRIAVVPVGPMGCLVVANQSPGRGKHQCHGMLRDRARKNVADNYQRNASPVQATDCDVVISDTVTRNQLEVRTAVDVTGGQALRSNQQRIGRDQPGHQRFGRVAVRAVHHHPRRILEDLQSGRVHRPGHEHPRHLSIRRAGAKPTAARQSIRACDLRCRRRQPTAIARRSKP